MKNEIYNIDSLNKVQRLLQTRKQTIAVAESCTAGLIQNAFSQCKDAMSVFQGGMVLYNLGQKSKQLNVNPIFAEECNSVSKEIAEKMAVEIAWRYNAELGLSITGYSEAVPEKGITDCYAYVALAEHSKIIFCKKIKGKADIKNFDNQRLYVEKIFEELAKVL